MLIAFIHDQKSFLPEINTYSDYFLKKGFDVITIKPQDLENYEVDIEWHIMGLHTRKTSLNSTIIHEYTSASAPPFRKIRDLIKKLLNIQPHYRLFLNQFVKEQFNFKDRVPSGYRDMFISSSINQSLNEELIDKKYDFVYLGNLHKTRKINTLIRLFIEGALKPYSLLIVSKEYGKLKSDLQNHANITFAGPVLPSEVGIYLSKARFAINFIPVQTPFDQQTSTKILEYSAQQIPIITTRYKWIEDFQMKYGGKFFYLDSDLSNFTWENVNNFEYAFPDLSIWTWENQIRRSGILKFLKSRFPGIQF